MDTVDTPSQSTLEQFGTKPYGEESDIYEFQGSFWMIEEGEVVPVAVADSE